MARPIDFKSFQNQVHEYAQDCVDDVTNSKSVHFGDGNLITFQGGDANGLFGAQGYAVQPNEGAIYQVQSRLGAPPTRWLNNPNTCPDELRVDILNKLVDLREDTRWLMRMKADRLRAVLSDQYTKFDNAPLVDLVAEGLDEIGMQPQVFRPQVGDTMRAYILFPQVTVAQDPKGLLSSHGDGGLHPALYVANDETGRGMVRVHGGLFRAICSNGAIFGWQKEDLFGQRHRFLSENIMRLFVTEAIASGLKMSAEGAERLIRAQEVHLQKPNLKGIMDGLAERYGLTVDTRETMDNSLASELFDYGRPNDATLFDLVNAITFTAQSRGEEERETMERMAGDLLFTSASGMALNPAREDRVAEEV